MQKRVVLVSAAVAVLGLAAYILGSVAGEKSQGFLSSESVDGQQHCVYRHNPGLGCGVAGALLVLAAVALATVASGDGRATGRRRASASKSLQSAWAAALIATVMFLCGASMKPGHGRSYGYPCTELKTVFFNLASIFSGYATGYSIDAYVSFQRTDVAAPGVAMGRP